MCGWVEERGGGCGEGMGGWVGQRCVCAGRGWRVEGLEGGRGGEGWRATRLPQERREHTHAHMLHTGAHGDPRPWRRGAPARRRTLAAPRVLLPVHPWWV